jgi:hypothetical protein
MKSQFKIFFILFLIISIPTITFSKRRHKPVESYAVIEGKKIKLTNSQVEILSQKASEIRLDKKSHKMFFYANKSNIQLFKDLIYDNKINEVFSSVNSYPKCLYKNEKSSEKAIALLFKEKYQLPKNLDLNAIKNSIIFYAIIETNGKLSFVKQLKGINKDIDQSIINFLIKNSKWKPAKIGAIKVRYKKLIGIKKEWIKQI